MEHQASLTHNKQPRPQKCFTDHIGSYAVNIMMFHADRYEKWLCENKGCVALMIQ